MAKLIIYLIFILNGFVIISAQTIESTNNIDRNTKVNWLKDNVIPIKSIDPDNDDYSDLEAIKSKIGDSRIVLLGEQSHGDGTTFLTKTRLIKFLVKKLGFDVIIFESGLYDCSKVNEFINNSVPAIDAIRKGVFSIWNKSEQFQPLIDFIEKNKNKLQIAGVDCQFTGEASKEYFVKDLESFLKNKGIDTSSYSNWSQTKAILRNISEERYIAPPPIPPNIIQQDNFEKTLSQIISTLQSLPNNSDTNFWVQLLKSTIQQGKSIWLSYGLTDFSKMPVETKNIRDIQMGDNLIWQVTQNYPNNKIIVWAATFHIARNVSIIKADGIPNYYKGMITMGDVAYKSLGNQFYSIGFTAYEGNIGYANNTYKYTLEKPSPNSLEGMIFSAGYNNCFLDFRSIDSNDNWLKHNILCRPLGYLNCYSNWTQNMDAIIYNRTMIPSTKVPE